MQECCLENSSFYLIHAHQNIKNFKITLMTPRIFINFYRLCKNYISFLCIKLHAAINLPSILYIVCITWRWPGHPRHVLMNKYLKS